MKKKLLSLLMAAMMMTAILVIALGLYGMPLLINLKIPML